MAYQSRPANETVSERFLTIITTQRALSQIFQRRACTFRLFQNSIDAVNKFKMRILYYTKKERLLNIPKTFRAQRSIY
jgi:hypothetical protein